MPDNLPNGEVIVTAIVMAAILLVGLSTVVSPLMETQDEAEQRDPAVLLDGTNFVEVTSDNGRGTSETVRDSRGNALSFTGASDSYIAADSQLDVAAGTNWTVHQGVIEMQDTTQNQILLSIGDPDLLLVYVNNTSGTDEFGAIYYQAADQHMVNVSVSNPGQHQFIAVTLNGTNLTIYRNGTTGESVNISTDGGGVINASAASNCNCTLDETRTFNDVLNDSQRSTLRSKPVGPLPSANRTARIMYDAGSGTTVRIFFASTDATASNVSWVSGFEGHVLDEKTGPADMFGANDYKWRKNGPKIAAVDGGRIDGAPVAYVSYTFEGGVHETVGETIADAFAIAGVGITVIVIGAMLAGVKRL